MRNCGVSKTQCTKKLQIYGFIALKIATLTKTVA